MPETNKEFPSGIPPEELKPEERDNVFEAPSSAPPAAEGEPLSGELVAPSEEEISEIGKHVQGKSVLEVMDFAEKVAETKQAARRPNFNPKTASEFEKNLINRHEQRMGTNG